MRLSKDRLLALKTVAPKSAKDGGTPSVRIGTVAEAADFGVLLRLKVADGRQPPVRVVSRVIKDAATIVEDEKCCEVVAEGKAVELRLEDGSTLTGEPPDHPWPNTQEIRRLPSKQVAASVHLEPKLLKRLALALSKVAVDVELEMPKEEGKPLRFSWPGGEAFLMPTTIERAEPAPSEPGKSS